MSRDIQQALEQLLDESRALNGNRPADIETEAEALALYQMSRRLRRLRARRAPERLRRSAWARAMARTPRFEAKPELRLLNPPTVLRKVARHISALDQARGRDSARRRTEDVETEAEAAVVYEMRRRMEPLRAQRAPDRLRRSAWNRAMAVPIQPEPRRKLFALDPPPAWFQAAGRVAASILAVATVGYGAVAASASSLPTSPLYPVKLLVEDIVIAVAPADQRSELFISQANRRLDESDALAKEDRIDVAERVVEEASRTIESARTAAALATNPGFVQQAITSTESRARTTEQTIEQKKPASEQRVVSKPVESVVVPVAIAPTAEEDSTALTLPVEAPSPRIEALETPPDRTSMGSGANAPVVSGGPAAASSNAINPRPIVAAPAGVSTMHPIDAHDGQAPAPSPTRGGVIAPHQQFLTVEPIESAVPAAATTTPATTRTPTRTPTTSTQSASPVPANSAGAPTSGYSVVPVDRGTPPGPADGNTARPTR